MPTSAERPAAAASRRRLCRAGLGLLLALPGCSRDLSLPEPPPPVSCRVRVTVTVLRDDAARVSVSAVRTLDASGNPAGGSIPQDEKSLQPVLNGQSRSAELNFPADATLIEPGSWDFKITVKSVVPPGGDERVWETTCTTELRKDGLTRLDAMDGEATCTGDFVTFTGEHEVGIEEVKLEPADPRVGSSPGISLIVKNKGASQESFVIALTARDVMGNQRGSWTEAVQGLPAGATRFEPMPNDPPITWDTSLPVAGQRPAPGLYIVEAAIKPPVAGDRTPVNDERAISVRLGPGDTDGDGRFDDQDNCPTTPNPLQENCDPRPAGDACETPEIRSFMPNCQIGGGDTVTVIGFGFAQIQPGDITLGGQPAASVVSRSACRVAFVNPQANANPTGNLRIATTPPVEAALCCSMPRIDAIDPLAGAPQTIVTVQGCGLTGVDVLLEPILAGGTPSGRIAPEASSTSVNLLFKVPATITRNATYLIRLVRDQPPRIDLRSPVPFTVQ